MKKQKIYFKIAYFIFACTFMLLGCSDKYVGEENISREDRNEEPEEGKMEQTETEQGAVPSKDDADTEDIAQSILTEPEIIDADWSGYFNGVNGEAVIYDASNRRYTIRLL